MRYLRTQNQNLKPLLKSRKDAHCFDFVPGGAYRTLRHREWEVTVLRSCTRRSTAAAASCGCCTSHDRACSIPDLLPVSSSIRYVRSSDMLTQGLRVALQGRRFLKRPRKRAAQRTQWQSERERGREGTANSHASSEESEAHN